MYQESPGPIIRTTLATLVIIGLIGTSLWVMLPFIGAIVWGTIIAISAHPTYERLKAALGGRPRLAATILAFILAGLVFVPLTILVVAAGRHISAVSAHLAHLETLTIPSPPLWLADVPLVGRRLVQLWEQASDIPHTFEVLRPQIREGILWALTNLASSTLMLFQAAFAIVLSAFFLLSAPRLHAFFLGLMERLGAHDSAMLLKTIGTTTRSVSKGILGTALIQAIFAWAGFAVVGAPAPVLLAFVCLILCSIQLGIMLVGIPVAIWLWAQDQIGAAVFIFFWSIFVSVGDSVLKPIMLGRDFPVPLWLVFVGVIGGLISMGLIGLFIGPVILSISYLLVTNWTTE
jgi:predicted PurR-regulated permease PerM